MATAMLLRMIGPERDSGERGPGERGLLPAGMRDVLPPKAGFEAATVEGLMAVMARYGYERVKPPLVEFEETLLTGAGAAMTGDTFRLMDPVSQRMMGLRADMTLQIARIAASRLVHSPRPLRLSYAGEVLRVKGGQVRSERQFAQVGAELIGAAGAAADAEAVALAADALAAIGIARPVIDLSSPKLVPAVAAAHGIEVATGERLRQALDRKDAAAVEALGGAAAPTLVELVKAAGPAAEALAALGRLELPAEASSEAQRLAEVVALLGATRPELQLTIDPVENRGFEYHTGLCFTVLADRVRGELGRGGRYLAGDHFRPGQGEEATGFTLFMDSILRALPDPALEPRAYLPVSAPAGEADRWRSQGWAVVAGLDSVADPAAEARRLGCSHVILDGQPQAVEVAP